jgi:hypothetical protein
MSTDIEESGPIQDPAEGGWNVAYPTDVHSELFDSGARRALFYTVKVPTTDVAALGQGFQNYQEYINNGPQDYYIRIFTAQFGAYIKSNGGGITSAYLSVKAIDDIIDGKFKWIQGALPIRATDGSPKAIKHDFGRDRTFQDSARIVKWSEWLLDAFPEQKNNQASWSRSINPAIELKLLLVNKQQFLDSEFEEAVKAIFAKDNKCKQTYKIVTSPPADCILVSNSITAFAGGDH